VRELPVLYDMYCICSWCGHKMATITVTDPRLAGKTTHGVCTSCVSTMEKMNNQYNKPTERDNGGNR